jgi:hypothetical protein
MTTLGMIVVVALVLSIFVFKVPQRIGLVKPASERLLSQTPDRAGALQIKADLQKAGLNTTGVDLYVFPEKNSDKSVMLAVLDSSKGFYFSNSGKTDAISDYLIRLASANSTGINRVAFEYLDSEGNALVDLTAPTDVILKYSRGQISRIEFLKAIDAKIDLSQIATSGLP